MIDEVQRWWESLDNARQQVRRIVEAMDGEALNWRPLDRDTNSVGALVTHLCGSEAFWVWQVLGGTDVQRNRDAEFQARARGAQELLELLDRTAQASGPVLERLAPQDMESLHDPGAGLPNLPHQTTRQVLLRVVTHTYTHLGHMELTRQLWEAGRAS